MYLAGYNDAIGIVAFGGAAGGGSPEDTQKLIHTLWPRGYNLGNLGDELDKLCPTTAFQKMRISLVIAGIAAKAQRAK